MNEVVSTVNFEGEVYIFCKNGDVYKMYKDFSSVISFQLMYRMDLRQ